MELQINEPREVTKGTLKFGSYEETLPEIEKLTGKKNYDVEMTYWGGALKSRGSLTDDGSRIIMPAVFTPNGELEEFYWMSKEEFEELRDAGEPIEAMSCPYKIEPERLGKLLWISGPPGAGKGTQSEFIVKKFNLFKLSTGDLLREEIKKKSILGIKITSIVNYRSKWRI